MLFCLHSHCIHQILDSVSYTHQHDIVHRDLKVWLLGLLLHCFRRSEQEFLISCGPGRRRTQTLGVRE
ncbi:hypothetical protein FQN60_000036 [Etheostoma spectabile]|uniref:Protein kinase domain-containing protein n=1 Tax=Etheostoma spectabile TaxID=54343 RepID=A0A5J5CBG5_9PERO|nr:hypothetical protein FQN60_000036 [Etheostoma spectabile]